MTNIQRLLKTNEATISSIDAIINVLIREIVDSMPLKGIITDNDRYSAIGEDVSDYCMVNGIDEKLVSLAVQNIMRNKKDYNIPEEELNMLFKLRSK